MTATKWMIPLFTRTTLLRGNRRYEIRCDVHRAESKDNFVARQEYYVGLKLTDMEEDPINGDLTNFDLLNGCSHKGTFKIESANDTKIQPEDGSSYDTADDEFCVGTSPTVTIDVNAISADSKVELNKDGTDASIDWFAGSVEEFNSAMSADGILLSDAMAKFRVAYPDLSKPEDVQPNGIFTSPMKEYLVKLAKTRHIDGRPMLSFASLKYDFKPGKLIATLKDSLNYVTALPYLINEKYEAEEYTFCDAPIEVKFKVSANGPTMFHGLDMQYPDELIDVPIRIGMHQIEKAADDNNMLRVPVLKVSTPSTLATRLKLRDILNQNEVRCFFLKATILPISEGSCRKTAKTTRMFSSLSAMWSSSMPSAPKLCSHKMLSMSSLTNHSTTSMTRRATSLLRNLNSTKGSTTL